MISVLAVTAAVIANWRPPRKSGGGRLHGMDVTTGPPLTTPPTVVKPRASKRVRKPLMNETRVLKPIPSRMPSHTTLADFASYYAPFP